ncbi:MAG: hypothetical protein ACTH58_04545 [Marinomonas foliarum]|uniref:hypothetical protein n=1 Tax=Marinomonas TaxID=28253 RepID=UPI003F9994D7
MAHKKLQRSKITSSPKASIVPISPTGRFEVFLGDEEGTVSVIDLMDLHDSEKIIRELSLYVRGKRNRRSAVNSILPFLRHVLMTSEVVDTDSLKSYKDSISKNDNITLNTKYQKLLTATNFFKHLINANVIPKQVIPKGFDSSKIQVKNKQSFSEIARVYVEDDNNFNPEELEEVAKAFNFGNLEAKALMLSLCCIDLLHKEAIIKIEEWESDWVYVDSIISSLSNDEINKFKKVRDFIKNFPIPERTFEEAFSILYSKFGRVLPSVRFWPVGIEGFFRSKGWKSSNVVDLFKGKSSDLVYKKVFESTINKLTSSQLEYYKNLDTYRHLDNERDPRSIDLAIKVLYSHYGRLVPESSTWPVGLLDFFKYRGWSGVRIRSAFFPTTNTISPFIVGLLSYIELSPNVDTVARYTYLNSFRPSKDSGKIVTFFDKFRSEPLIKNCDASDPIIAACSRHVERMKQTLSELGTQGKSFLRLEKTPLWLQFTPNAGRENIVVKLADATTITNLVRNFINVSSKKNPILTTIKGSVGENFRPTCTLILRLTGERSSSIQHVLNHKSPSTTHRYTERVLTQSLLKTKAKSFQQYLVNTSENNIIKEDGSHLKPLHNDLFDVSESGVDEWINCDAQRIWFQDLGIIAEWIAWEKAISESQEEILFSNPERWNIYWAPRLAKYRNILALASSVDKKKARELAKNIVLPPLS